MKKFFTFLTVSVLLIGFGAGNSNAQDSDVRDELRKEAHIALAKKYLKKFNEKFTDNKVEGGGNVLIRTFGKEFSSRCDPIAIAAANALTGKNYECINHKTQDYGDFATDKDRNTYVEIINDNNRQDPRQYGNDK